MIVLAGDFGGGCCAASVSVADTSPSELRFSGSAKRAKGAEAGSGGGGSGSAD